MDAARDAVTEPLDERSSEAADSGRSERSSGKRVAKRKPSAPPLEDTGTPEGEHEETEPAPSSGEAAPTAHGNGLARYAFYSIWVVAVPLAAAVASVWLLAPPPGAGQVGVLRNFIGEQKIPAGILFFTAFAIVVWRFRHELPLAGAAGVGGRRDVPHKLRARYDEAGALLEEARRILKTRRRDIEKELTKTERDDLRNGLEDLERTMLVEPFAPAAFEKAHGRAERLVGEHLARWRKGEIREYAESIAIAVGVALLLRGFVIEAFKIPSGSMIPTLLIGDHIFVNKAAYGPLLPFTDKRLFSSLPPQRGDVIVFKYPENPEQDFIKRVIAAPEDTLAVVDGRPIINGWLVPHCRVGTFRNDGQESELYVEFLHDRAYFTQSRQPSTDMACESSVDCPRETSCYFGLCGRDGREYKAKGGEVWVLGDNRDNSHDSRAWNKGNGAGVPFDNIKGRAMIVFATFGPNGNVAERMLVDVMGPPRLPASNAALQPAVDKCLRERPKQTEPPPAN